MALSFRTCLSTLGITRETFKQTDWGLHSDSDLVRSMIKCMIKDFGLFDENLNGIGGFNKDRMVKQFGGETVRERVEKCIDNNPIEASTVDKSVQNVMKCLESENLKLYREN